MVIRRDMTNRERERERWRTIDTRFTMEASTNDMIQNAHTVGLAMRHDKETKERQIDSFSMFFFRTTK
jgi:hypothetical protein